LDGRTFNYDALDAVEHCIDPSIPVAQDHEDFNDFSVDPTICLKVGAQVILMKNIQRQIGLVNGSRGIIEDFVIKEDPLAKQILSLPLVRFTNGKRYLIGYQEFIRDLDDKNLRLIRHQLPLKLGWAITVHKAQGMTLERAEMDLPQLFSPGQAYVALSRAKSLDGLIVKRLSRHGIFCNPRVAQFYQELWKVSKSIHEPIQKSISM
jgi:ATP-dependent DNA helicase PIF1